MTGFIKKRGRREGLGGWSLGETEEGQLVLVDGEMLSGSPQGLSP